MDEPRHHPAVARIREEQGPRPLVAAHRGASILHPENTLAAFRSAAALGVAVQEFDVRELQDGELVCVHDATFSRTTNAAELLGADRPVDQCNLAEVLQLDCGRGERVPTLAAALDVMLPGAVPLIEHKAGRARTYVDAINDGGYQDSVVLQSFDWQFLREVAQLNPNVALAALGPTPTCPQPDDEAINQLRDLRAAALHWRAADLTLGDVERAHKAGLLVFSYTTDDAAGWQRGRELQIDAMCTNDPANMVSFLKRT